MKYTPPWASQLAFNEGLRNSYELEGIRHIMAFVPVTNVAWVFIAQFDGNVPYHNNIYASHPAGAPTHAQVQELADDMFTWHKFAVLPLLASDCQLTGVTCQMLDSLVGDFAVSYELPSPVGAHTGGHVPTNCGARIDFLTADTTRAGKGNNTVSGVPRDVVTKERLDAVWYEEMRIGYETLLSAMTAGWEWVIVSRRISGADRVSGVTNAVTEVVTHDPIVVSRRSRLLKSAH